MLCDIVMLGYIMLCGEVMLCYFIRYDGLLGCVMLCCVVNFCYAFIHSFINLYSAPSRGLVRGASDSSTAKNYRFEFNKECFSKSPREQAYLPWEPVPDHWAHHGKGSILHSCSSCKWD